MNGGSVRAAAIVMGWMAPRPRRALESERILTGKRITEDLAREAARGSSGRNTVIEELVQSSGSRSGGETDNTRGGRMIGSVPTCKWLRTKDAFVPYGK